MSKYIPTIDEFHHLMKMKNGTPYLDFEDFLNLYADYSSHFRWLGIEMIDHNEFTKQDVLPIHDEIVFSASFYDKLLDKQGTDYAIQFKNRLNEAYTTYKAPDINDLTKEKILDYFFQHPSFVTLKHSHSEKWIEDMSSDIDRWLKDPEKLKGLMLIELVYENNDFDKVEFDKYMAEITSTQNLLTVKDWRERMKGKCFLAHEYAVECYQLVEKYLESVIGGTTMANIDLCQAFLKYLLHDCAMLQLSDDEKQNALSTFMSKINKIKDEIDKKYPPQLPFNS